MRLSFAGVLSFFAVLWHWCDGQRIPEELQKYNISPPNMFGRESPTNKTIDQLIMAALGDHKGTLNLKGGNGGILMELDMLLSRQQYYSLYDQTNSSTLIRSKRKSVRNPIFRWTNGEIPYRFYPGHFNQRDQYMVRQAMSEWERYTCLRFREAAPSDINAIYFSNNIGCYSQLGMVGGQQEVSLSSPSCRHTGLYLHEIGHAIGLVHEHQLPNRDDYVEILTQNVLPGMLDQFTKYTSQVVDQMNVPYEYSSVMHYGVTAFSKNPLLKTIRVKYPEKEANIGEVYNKGLSFTDVEIVNKMYRCHAKCDPNIKCSGGYVDENCRCVCKNGSHDCQIGGGVKPSGDTCGVNTHADSWKCFVWAQQGQCDANPTKMKKECARACGPCGLKRKPGTCAKMYPSDKCLKWSRNGDCLTNTEWMNNYCCGTCVNSNNGTRCQNKHINSIECDSWASKGECENNPLWMIPNCQKSCGACDKPIATQAPATTPAPDIGNCTDKHDTFQCQNWAQAGECEKNPTWMEPNCQRSCGKCSLSGKCTDKHDTLQCQSWAQAGECEKNPTWMVPNCQRSCRKCSLSGNCTDKHDTFQCQSWAQAGECEKNPTWMVPNCQRSCGKCSLSGNCTDKHDTFQCQSWAQAGECEKNPTWMEPNCQRSCGKCSLSDSAVLEENELKGNCTDKHDTFQCQSWAQAGECEKNPTWMIPNCQRSCGKCSLFGNCTDKHDTFQCQSWAQAGECEKNPTWMLPNCQRSCGKCSLSGNCTDKHDTFQCQSWAQAGECEKNPTWMVPNCQRSCGKCSLSGNCTDKHDTFQCQSWAQAGECEKNPTWMIPNCQRSCGKCSLSGGCRDENDTCATWARYGFCKYNRDQAVRFCPKTCNLCDQRHGLLLR